MSFVKYKYKNIYKTLVKNGLFLENVFSLYFFSKIHIMPDRPRNNLNNGFEKKLLNFKTTTTTISCKYMLHMKFYNLQYYIQVVYFCSNNFYNLKHLHA